MSHEEDPPIDQIQNIEKTPITPKGVSFDAVKNTLLLDLDNNAVDLDKLKELAEKNGFEPKTEFHITVLGFKNGSEVKKALKALPEPERQNAIEQIKSIVDSTDWNFTFEDQRFHLSKEYITQNPKNKGEELKEKRESYIQMINLPGMEIFYDKLNAILGTNLEAPPAHITLYTSGDDKEKSKMGIGINTDEEFLKLDPRPI